MPTQLDEARAKVAQLETEEKLVAAMEKAAEKADANPTAANLSNHNRSQEELADFRAQIYPSNITLGGDVVKDEG
jgi:hypothetical protein